MLAAREGFGGGVLGVGRIERDLHCDSPDSDHAADSTKSSVIGAAFVVCPALLSNAMKDDGVHGIEVRVFRGVGLGLGGLGGERADVSRDEELGLWSQLGA